MERKPRVHGWRTSDEEEIERRRQRAATEPLEIEPVERRQPLFGTYEVGSRTGGVYEVEIRSLAERANSCSCPDHQINGLGTCKHIEAVLAWLAHRRTRTARLRPPRGGTRATAKVPGAAPAKRSGRAEVFLDRRLDPPRVRVQWPAARPSGGGGLSRPAVRALLAPFLGAHDLVKGEPLAVLPALARRLARAPKALQAQVRLSRQLQPWLEEQRRKAARAAARSRFLAEVEAGRRSLDFLKLPLYPYQREGMLHLAFGERALLADEMGLGKTAQAVAACELLRQLRGIERVLVVSPASVKVEWQEQIAKFTALPVRVFQGSRAQRLRQYAPGSFFYLANYEQVLSDAEEIQRHLAPDVIILDEAQRIKNWQSKTAQAVKRLRSSYAFVLTGTPIENRIDELYSLVQFLDPSLFGPLFRFNRDFYELDDRGRPTALKNLHELHRRIRGILLRRRKDEVEEQLPGRTVNNYFVPMESEQIARYEEYNEWVARLMAKTRERPLTPEEFDQLQTWLACMRMICDTPYILDPDCRVCPKLAELEEILAERLAEPQAKILVFSEWERMLELVRELVEEKGLPFAWHTGSVPQARRRVEIRRFKDEPACRLFLSTDSGGLGLNLQAASVVINLDLPWNPARLEQRIARAWRKHQTRPVHVINLVTEGSIEHRMLPLLAQKQALADGVLDGRGDLDSLALPTGRGAFIARVQAVLGEPRETAAPVPAAPRSGPERLRDHLVDRWPGGLLLLELRAGPSGQETVFAVLDRVGAGDRGEVAALVGRCFADSSPAPALNLLDRATFEAIERLVNAGVMQFTAGEAQVLHRSPALALGQADLERQRRMARARELGGHAERKARMAAVLGGGGFPVEALTPLRDAVETGVRALLLAEAEEAERESDQAPGSDGIPLPRIAASLARHDGIEPVMIELIARLRGGPEALLAVEDDEARAWIASGQRLVGQIAHALAGGAH
ncbi:MAG TPA: DEAD/DEAH box helicase [Thermoanaerobaculia bacterium]|nr:DEAD/DEAH box helicase [Thermoanaerobaculia bacterium]